MSYHQSYVFLQDISNSFHRWFNLSIFHHGVSQQFGGVSHRHSQILKTEEEFLLNLAPFSSRFMVLACRHLLIIVFDCENSFQPSGAIHESFQFDSPKVIISEDLFVLNIQLSFSKSYRCIIQVFSNQFMISSFHLYLNSLKYLRSFSNSTWRCVCFLRSFF